MSKTYVGNQATSLEVSPDFLPYSKIIAWYDDENAFVAGDDSGRTLEVDLPFATQEIVDNMLARIKGYVYRPYEATDALLDPAAELGDGVTINGTYSLVAAVTTNFNSLGASDLSAPSDEEVDHEFPYKSPLERTLQRKVTLGASYYGTTITRAKGLEITKTNADGTTGSRALLNSDVFAMYDDNGTARIYFDPTTGRYKFVGDLDISGGSINMSGGSITWGENNPAAGKISASQARTIITEELVSSPTIAGAKFYSRQNDGDIGFTWLEIGTDGGPGAGDGLLLKSAGFVSRPVFGVYNGDFDATAFYAKGYNFLMTDGTYGITYPQGTWDFSNATTKGIYLEFTE